MNIFQVLFVQPIFNLLTWIYSVIPGGDFGVAVIIFTILIRFAMYPLVKKQLHQTRAMRKLQPELKKIKKSANGNRQIEATQMMALYKKHGVSPFRSIGILLLQLPIFIGLYYSIRIFTLQRDEIAQYTYGFLETLKPVKQLIDNPDTFNEKLLGVVDLTKHAIGQDGVDIVLLILALMSAATQYVMSRQTMPTTDTPKKFRDIMKEAAEGKQADQSEMNALVMHNMTKFMPILMFFIMISLPGAIALYYTVSNLVAVGQQAYLLKRDEVELEEIAEEETPEKNAKKPATAKREKKAKEAHITRIVASDSKRRRK